MNNHMSLKLVGANSSLELNSPITSIYLQEELTGLTTLPGIRETKGMNIGMDGGWTSAQFYEPRLITIKGVIANQDVAVVEQRRKQLIQLLAEKRLALEFQTEAGNHYTMDVVVAGVQMPLSKVLTASYFQLNLRADDPLIYDNNALAELEAILRRSSSASSGFSINFPINFQLGVSESRPTIDNFGSSVIYPVITLTGPLTTPEIVNITTNMAFTIDEVLGAGAYTLSGIRGVMTQEGTVETASGSAFQITGIEGAPLTLTEITGNATQNGTPTPDAPVAVNTTTGENVVKITGKNLLELQDSTNTSASVNFAVNNGTITASGTTTRGSYAENDNIIPTLATAGNYPAYTIITEANSLELPAGTYTLSAEITKSGNVAVGLAIGVGVIGARPTTSTKLEVSRNVANGTYTRSATVAVAEGQRIYPSVWYEGNSTNKTVGLSITNIQLELGSTATAYEPYQGQEFEVNLGKNLFKPYQTSGSITANGVTFTMNADGTITLNGNSTGNTWLEFVSDFGNGTSAQTTPVVLLDSLSTYTTSIKVKSGSFTGTPSVHIQKNATTEHGYYLNTTNTMTDANGLYRAWFRISNTDTFTNATIQIQLERGSATTYAPYFAPIELAKIGTYQDKIYKEGEKWYIEKNVGKVVLNGSEDGWTFQASNAPFRYRLTGSYSTYDDASTFISDYFQSVAWNASWADYDYLISLSSVNNILAFRYAGISALADFTTWLASHPTAVYYALATPTTTEITDSTLLAQLNFIANLYGGTNNIMLVGTGAQGEIEVRTGQIIGVIDSLSIVGTSGSIDINLNGSELAAVGSVTDELTINGTTGAVTKTARIGKIASYAGESITTDYISTTGGLDTGATVYYVLPSSSTSTLSTLDSTALASFNGIVASGGVSAQTNIGSISVDVTTLSAQDVAVVDTKQHTVTINGVGAYSKFSGDWLTLDVGLNELQLITENNTDTGSAVIKYRVGYMGV